MFQNWEMTDPILYLSMLMGFGGVYVLITSFHDDDDGGDDGEKYIYYLEQIIQRDSWFVYKKHIMLKSLLQKRLSLK